MRIVVVRPRTQMSSIEKPSSATATRMATATQASDHSMGCRPGAFLSAYPYTTTQPSAATMLGKADPLDTRVTELEQRLDSLEKPAGTRGTAPTRTKPAERRGEHEATQPKSEGEHTP